jgi:hypothetical protein
MSIVASDIVVYGAANIAEDDSNTHGGAIATTTRYIFGDATLVNAPAASGGDGTLLYNSTNNTDNGITVTAYGRNVGGSLVSEAKTLGNSGVAVTGTQVFERILKVVTDAHSYNIEVKDSAGNEVVTIESGVTTVRRPFYNVSSDPNSEKIFYEKAFVKNNHATLNLLGASFIDGGGDSNGYITFALPNAVNDTESVANRVTAPTGTGADGFSASTKTLNTNVGSADLSAGDAVAVWMKMTLPQSAVAGKDTWTLQVSGSTI